MRTKLQALWHKRKKRRERRPSQIEQLEDRRMLFSDWQNPSNHYDVNHDGVVTPLDVPLGINYLGENNSPVLPQRVNASDPYYDVNGDRSVSPVDILQVINYLNGAGHDSATVDTKGFVSLPLKALPGNATQRVEVNVTSLLDSGDLREAGLFVMDDASGTVDGTAPDHPDYARKVLASGQRSIMFSPSQAEAEAGSEFVFPGGSHIGIYVLQPHEANGPAEKYFRLTTLADREWKIGWEEHETVSFGVPTIGDRGYDDAFFWIRVSAPTVGTKQTPVLGSLPDRTINEHGQIGFTITATDLDSTNDKLRFRLTTDAAGVQFDEASGEFRWTPSEAQGPGVYDMDVVVTDDDGLEDSFNFQITVPEVNRAPVLATIGNKSIDELAMLTFTASASDEDIPTNLLTFSLDPADTPNGATIDAQGTFRWTPTEAQGPGTYTATVIVTDNGSPPLNDREQITITVREVNQAPVLGTIGNKSIDELVTLTFTASATDADIPTNTLTFSLDPTDTPSGATINSQTGVFTWTPTESQGPGTFTATVIVTDNGSPVLSDREQITITVREVNRAPVLAIIGDRAISAGGSVTIDTSATDSDIPLNALTFSLDPTDTPSGAAIDPGTGRFTWTHDPTLGSGTFTATIRVHDNGSPSLSDSETIHLIVGDGPQPPVLAAIGDKFIDEQATLTFAASATDADTPTNQLSFSLDPADTPGGAVIDPQTGVVTWTPTEADGPGIFTATIIVTDNGSPALTDREQITITVREVNQAPILATIGNKSIDELATLTFTATATDEDIPTNTLTFRLDPADTPNGATIDAQGTFRWTPIEAQGPGTYTATVIVTDNGSPSLTDREQITITVREVNQAPILATIGNKSIDELATLTFTATATDEDIPTNTWTFRLDPADTPNGATIDAQGTFRWTPTEAQGPGIYTATLIVTDNGLPALTDREQITITVREVNQAPTLAVIGDKSIDELAMLTFTATATDEDIPTNILAFSLDPADTPSGATIDSQGVFRWTPTEAQGPGTYTATVIVTDNGLPALTDREQITITVREVNQAPTLAVIGDKSIDELAMLTFTATATDEDIPTNTLTFSLDPADTPSGATIDSQGVFRWTPTEAQGPGTFTATVIVTDNGSPSLNDREQITITVREVNQAPTLAAIGDKSIDELAMLTFTATATDEDIPTNTLTYSLDPADTPSGATIDSQGVFRWTPTEAQGPGTYTATVIVTDNGSPSLTDREQITITVREVNQAPILATIGNKSIDELATLTFTATATDEDIPTNTLAFSLDPADTPSGATIDSQTGVFTWTPTEAQGPGTFTATVIVTDDGSPSLTDREQITITVREVNQAPVLRPIADFSILPGASNGLTVLATDPDLPANSLIYRLDSINAPPGATLDAQTGEFLWRHESQHGLGPFTTTIHVDDQGSPNLSDSVTFTISVTCGTPFDEWLADESGGSAGGAGSVSVDQCEAELVEGDSFLVSYQTAFTVPTNTPALAFVINELSFDTTNTSSMNDAIEAAVVDSQGQPLVGTIALGHDAFFNITEGENVELGGGAMYDANTDTVSLDISHLPAGTEATLIVRLVNNDADTATKAKLVGGLQFLTASPILAPSSATPLTAAAARATSIDFAHLDDVTPSIRFDYDRTTYDEKDDLLRAGVTLTNDGSYAVRGPILVGVRNITHPLVAAREFTGYTPSLDPYYTIDLDTVGPQASDATLNPGESRTFDLAFFDFDRQPFEYELFVLGHVNEGPEFSSQPVGRVASAADDVEAMAGKPYRYDSAAADPENDTLTYSLVFGPDGLSVDATSGVVAWTPTADDVGRHSVRLRTQDPFGAWDEQTFTIDVRDTNTPNRPPSFTSDPIVDAYVNVPYEYAASMFDIDGDDLTLSIAQSPQGVSIAALPALPVAAPYVASPAITWTPTAEYVDQLVSVTLQVDDGRGGVAEQPYQIYVHAQPGNHPPLIVSEPDTTFTLPNLVTNPPQGDVGPQLVPLGLAVGESGLVNVNITLPANAPPSAADILVLMDVSGSMGHEWEWSGEMVQQLEAALAERGISDVRYSLTGFTNLLQYSVDGPKSPKSGTIRVLTPSGSDDFDMEGGYGGGYATQFPIYDWIPGPCGLDGCSPATPTHVASTTTLRDITLDESGTYVFAITQPSDRADVFACSFDDGMGGEGSGGYSYVPPYDCSDLFPFDFRVYFESIATEVNELTLALNEVTAGDLAHAGQVDRYAFTLADDTWLYFDSQTPRGDMTWQLTGANSTDPRPFYNIPYNSPDQSDVVIHAPAGEYTLAVAATGLAPDDYRFRLLDLATIGTSLDAAALAQPVTGTLQPGLESDVFYFDAAQGESLLFDIQALTSGTIAKWRLFDPAFNELFSQSITGSEYYEGDGTGDPIEDAYGDQGPLVLPATGRYTLLVEAGINNQQPTVDYRFQIFSPTTQTHSLTLGQTVASDLSQPAERDEYTFQLTAATSLFFDVQLAATPPNQPFEFGQPTSFRWSLTGPEGNVVTDKSFDRDQYENYAEKLLADLPAGDYTLTISGDQDKHGDYVFTLRDVNQPTGTLMLDTPTTLTFDPGDSSQILSFTGAAGDRMLFEPDGWVAGSGFWILIGPYSQRLFDQPIDYHNYSATVTLPSDGDYSLIVFPGNYQYTTGLPAFTFTAVLQSQTPPPAPSGTPLTLGAVVQGELATASEIDSYTFTLAAPSRLYFDSLTNSYQARWSLTGPPGEVVQNRSFSSSDGASLYSGSALLMLPAGTYQLDVSGTASESYEFTLHDTATTSTLTIGTPVSASLNPGRQSHLYKFNATAGTEVLFDIDTTELYANLGWQVFTPYGRSLLAPTDEYGMGGSVQFADKDSVVLPVSGEYLLLVEGPIDRDTPLDYSFNVQPASLQTQVLTLGQRIDAAIDQAAESDQYTFHLADDTKLYLDTLTRDSNLKVLLTGPRGTLRDVGNFESAEHFFVAPAGDYTLTVTGKLDHTGSYSFQLLDAADAAMLPMSTSFTTTLAPSDSATLYHFTAAAGEEFYFDSQSDSGYNSHLRLVDPTGRDVFSQYLSSDPGLATATVGGTYTLVVAGRHTNTDASLDIPLRVDPISTTVQPLPLNTEVSQTTTVPQQPYEYTFTLDREAVLYFDSLTDQPPSDDMGMGEYSTNSFQWKLVGPEGVEVVDRPMHQSDAGDTTDLPRPGDPYDPYDTGDPSRQGVIQNLTAGDYTLTVTGTGDMTGDFGFRLLDLATTYPSVTPDTPLVSNLSPARETDAYQFDVSAGQRFSFDITSWSGPAAGRLRVVDRFGNVVVSTPASASAVTATLWLDGTYTVLVEGAAGDDAASRGYTLDVRLTGTDPLPELGQTIAFEQVVRDTLDSHTDKDVYSFTGQRHQRIYIDSLLDSSDTGDGVSLVGAGRVSLIAPSGKVVVDAVTSSTNIGPVELLEDGVYRLRVHTANAYDTTGDYAFRLLDLADQPTAQLDAVNGGTLTEAGFDHLFVYQGQPGERIVLRSDPWTTADTVALQSKLFSTRNGLEDGYYAIDRALNEVPQRDNVPLHVILVTDEDRYVHARNLTFASTLDDLQDRGATLHSLLDTVIDVGDQLDDDDGEYCPGATVNGAIGLDGLTGTDHAYYPDGNGGFTIAASGAGTFTPRCSPGENLEPFEDYGDLALQTFGTVWDLNQIELNANSRQSFSSAFVDAVVGQIEQQVGVTLRATDPTVQFEIVSTGGSARDLDFEVRFIGDGQPHSFDLQFVRTADPSVVLGSIPVTITTAYGYDVDAIDADNDVLTYELVGPTHGARLAAETGVMSWGPAAAGEYQFTTKVTDGRGGEDSQTWTVQVDVANADNRAPVFTAVDPLQVESNRGVTIDATATDPDGDQLFYQLLDDAAGGAALPAGVSINSATGAITWTPTRQQVGTHTIKVQVLDGHGGTAQLPIDIEVVRPVAFHNQRPEILSQPLTAAEGGDVYRYPVIAIDGDGDPISFDLSVAPAGMSIHGERGIIAWRPTRDQLGQQTVIVRVRDDQGGVGLQAFDIIVTSLNDPPQITSEPNGPAATGEPWEYQLAANDPNGDLLVYSLQAAGPPSATGSASAPPGATIDSTTGLIQWTPSAAGDYRFTVTADDQRGGTATQEFVLPVRSNAPPRILSTPGYPAFVGQEYVYTAVAYDPNAADAVALTLDAASLARGMTFASVACPLATPPANCVAYELRWTPNRLGNVAFTLTATDPSQATDVQTFTLPVRAQVVASRPPVFTSTPAGPAFVNELWQYALAATDPDGDAFTFSLEAGPSGMATSEGVVRWTPTAESAGQSVTLRVTDTHGAYSTQSFDLPVVAVLPTNDPPEITSIPHGPATTNQRYIYELAAHDPNGDPITFTIIDAPPGATLTPSLPPSTLNSQPSTRSTLTWTPTSAGDFDFTVTASDESGATATQAFTLPVVSPPNNAPQITSTPTGPATVDTQWSYAAQATDPDGDPLTYSLGATGSASVPPDATIDPTTGRITWQPNALGSYDFVLIVRDGRGGAAQQAFSLPVVARPNDPPKITSVPIGPAELGSEWSYTIFASDPNGDPLTFTLDQASINRGATLTPSPTHPLSRSQLTWTPTTTGDYDFDVTVSDGRGGSFTQTFTLPVIEPPNLAPTITSTPVGPANAYEQWTYQVVASDPDGDALTYSLDQASQDRGMTLSNSGWLDWSYVEYDLGGHPVSISVSDGRGGTATQSFTLTVVDPYSNESAPYFTSTPSGPIMLNKPWSYDANATNPDGDTVVYSLSATGSASVPAGMTIDAASGLIRWTPTEAGEFPVTVTADDQNGGTAFQEFLLTIGGNLPPTITSQPDGLAVVGELWSYPLEATDPEGDAVAFALDQASVDRGMTVDAAGVVRWTAAAAGSFAVVVTADDGQGGQDSQSFTVNAAAAADINGRPRFVSQPGRGGTVNRLWMYPARATDPDGDAITYSLVASGSASTGATGSASAPTGMTINASTGLIEWVPGTAGDYSVTVVATDARGAFAEQAFTLPVALRNDPPAVTSQPVGPLYVGQPWSYEIIAADPNGDPITFSIINAPSGATLTPPPPPSTLDSRPSTHSTLTWTPTATGSFDFDVQVTDAHGATGGQRFTVVVNQNVPSNDAPRIRSLPPTPAVLDQVYTYQVDAFDPNGDALVYSLHRAPGATGSASAPHGMTINAAGRLSWRPQSLGSYDVEIVVTDTHGLFTSQRFTLPVNPPVTTNTAPQTTSDPTGPAVRDRQWTYLVTATDVDGDNITLSLDQASLDRGATIDAANCPTTVACNAAAIVRWTPDTKGQFAFQIVADDGRDAVQQQFSLTVLGNAPPVITSVPDTQRTNINETYTYNIIAADPNGDPITFTLDQASLDNGITLTPSSTHPLTRALLTWTPDTAGLFTIRLTATDPAQAADDQEFELLVRDASTPNTVPVLNGEQAPRSPVQIGQLIVHQFTAMNADNDPLTFTLVDAPAGVILDGEGLLRWTPSSDQVTDPTTNGHPITVRVTDDGGLSSEATFYVHVTHQSVNHAPQITSLPKLGGVADAPYIYSAIATDEDNDLLVWSLVTAPVGMQIGQFNGRVTWSPTTEHVGKHSVTIRVTDVAGAGYDQDYELEVRGANRPATITSNPPITATVNSLYVYEVTARDPDDDAIRFSLDPAYVHDNMTIDRDSGRLTWTPTAAGTYRFVVRAVDEFGMGVQQVVDAIVGESGGGSNAVPEIVTTPRLVAEANTTYAYDVDATDLDGDAITYNLVSPAPVPGNMSFDTTTGEFTWTPTAADVDKRFAFKIEATDGIATTSQSWSFTVWPENHAPVVDWNPTSEVTAGQTYRYDVQATDADNDRLTYTLLEGPTGMTIDSVGRITWQTGTDDIANHTVRVSVSDGRAAPVEPASRVLRVKEDTTAPTVAILVEPATAVDAGDQVSVLVLATDNVGIATTMLVVDGQNVAVDSRGHATITFDAPGIYTITATVKDAAGSSTTVDELISVRDPNNAAPTVEITSPNDRAVITAPTDIVGNVTDSEHDLVRYTVSFAPLDGSRPFKVINEVEATAGQTLTDVNNMVIGKFDPTILANGDYTLRFEAEDANSGRTTTDRTVSVVGSLKLGRFTISFEDISIPLTGIPISAIRTYDSLLADKTNDVGFGWSLNFGGATVEVDRETLGGAFFSNFQPFVDGTRVYVTLPDGTRDGFTFEGIPNTTFFGIVFDHKPYFHPDPGNRSFLTVPTIGLKKIGDEYVSLAHGGVSYNPADPAVNTTYTVEDYLDILKYEVSPRTGQTIGYEDFYGNRLTLDAAGIRDEHGIGITFERDQRGRIVALIDPLSNRVEYSYDTLGNLVSSTDQEAFATTYTYREDQPHLLFDINDPRGWTARRNEYDADGRLARTIDPNERETLYRYDLSRLVQEVQDPTGVTTQITADDKGNVIEVVEDLTGDKFVWRFTYDDDGNVTSEFDPEGRQTTYTYDSLGNQTSIVLPHGPDDDAESVTVRTHFGDFSEVTIYPDGSEDRRFFDQGGNLVSASDVSGTTLIQYEYDDRGRMTRETDYSGWEQYTFDAKGKLSSSPRSSELLKALSRAE